MEGYAVGEFGTIVKLENAGVNWSPEDGEEDPKLLRVLSPDEKRNADGSTCHTQRHIRDVYFWNRHLAFFVGDFGYICRYGLLLNEDKLNSGPGQTVDQAINGDVDVYWQLQGADELGLNWGYIIDNKDYMLSHLNSIFCFKTSGVNNEQWQALGGDTKFMTPDAPISYSSHITCMAVGTQPGKREGNPKEGTTSAILKYTSRAVNEAAVDSEVPSYREEVEWKPQNSMTTAPLNDIYCIKQKEENIWEDDSDIHCYAVGDGGVIRYTSNGGASPWRTLFSGVKENLRKVSHRARAPAALPRASPRHSHISPRHPSPAPARW